MGSLTDAYDRRVGDGGTRSSRRRDDGDRSNGGERNRGGPIGRTGRRPRPYVGLCSLAVASGLLAGGVVLATSITAATAAGLAPIEATEAARVLCGLGLPLVLVGVLFVLPRTRRLDALAGIALALAAGGVVAFAWAYPDRWLGDPLDLTIPIVLTYAVGLVLSFLLCAASVLAFGRGANRAGDTDDTDDTDDINDADGTRRRETGGRTSL